MPEWIKTTGAMLIFMIAWDLIRIPLQAWVTRKFMQKDFDEIDDALDDVEEAIEEDNEENI